MFSHTAVPTTRFVPGLHNGYGAASFEAEYDFLKEWVSRVTDRNYGRALVAAADYKRLRKIGALTISGVPKPTTEISPPGRRNPKRRTSR